MLRRTTHHITRRTTPATGTILVTSALHVSSHTQTHIAQQNGKQGFLSRRGKELLLAAATTEFAQYGLAGARIDRIAERAGANKRLLYVYFGDKDELFTAVLKHQVGKLAEETPSSTATSSPTQAPASTSCSLTRKLPGWPPGGASKPTTTQPPRPRVTRPRPKPSPPPRARAA
ncbi:TetR/AcrR family transcriptional regulator [Streptomyces sp. NPDC005248]|uniref:TetR/AcrR family transcriptional regulator n=1 Tax=Streptomyces sp. NPDC005248 TaxID=3364709 RepID=UPI0036CC6574